ncbi:MAG: hypothetical protein KDK24_13320 [Pseudooceanicola sp.]|nr:hypothetical protein [Pseudooceanicola sp.]
MSGGWSPGENVYWLDDRRIGLVARRPAAKGSEYAFLRVGPDGQQDIVAELYGENHCRRPDGQFLFRLFDRTTVLWSTRADSLAPAAAEALSECREAAARGLSRFAARFGDLWALGTDGTFWAGVADRGAAGAELLLFDADETAGRWPVDIALGEDIVDIVPLDGQGRFLVYPAFNAQRRADLRSVLPGIPVWTLAPGSPPELRHVPWADWNAQGIYRILPVRDGLAFAVAGSRRAARSFAGIYLESEGWAQAHAADLLPETLAVSPDRCRLAWTERREDARLPVLMTGDLCKTLPPKS